MNNNVIILFVLFVLVFPRALLFFRPSTYLYGFEIRFREYNQVKNTDDEYLKS